MQDMGEVGGKRADIYVLDSTVYIILLMKVH